MLFSAVTERTKIKCIAKRFPSFASEAVPDPPTLPRRQWKEFSAEDKKSDNIGNCVHPAASENAMPCPRSGDITGHSARFSCASLHTEPQLESGWACGISGLGSGGEREIAFSFVTVRVSQELRVPRLFLSPPKVEAAATFLIQEG